MEQQKEGNETQSRYREVAGKARSLPGALWPICGRSQGIGTVGLLWTRQGAEPLSAVEWGSPGGVHSEPPPGQWLFLWSKQTGLPPAWGVVSGETRVEKMALLSPISGNATNVLETLLTK